MLLAPVVAHGESRPKQDYDFALYDFKDKLHRVSALRRRCKLVVVDFFSIHCKPCKEALPLYKRLYITEKAQGLCVVVVAEPGPGVDRQRSAEKTSRFLNAQKLPFAAVWDKYGLVAKRYGLLNKGQLSLPQAFVLRKDGSLHLRGRSFKELNKAVQAFFRDSR